MLLRVVWNAAADVSEALSLPIDGKVQGGSKAEGGVTGWTGPHLTLGTS